MAVDTIYKIHSIVIVPNGNADLDVGNTYIGALQNVSMPVQASVTREVLAGKTFATSGRIDFTTVDLSFSSPIANEMLSLVGLSGACFAPGGDKVHVYAAQYDCSGPVAGSVHRRYEITKGMLYLQNAQCDHKGDLLVGAQIQAVFDGTNSPVVVTDNVALPTPVLLGDESARWTLHEGAKTIVNANAVSRKRSVSVDFGTTTSTQGADSDTFDSFSSIDSVLPVVTVSGIDPRWFDSIGLTINGAAVTHANTSIPFRKRDGAGGFVADATAEHIIMTANGPAYYDQLLSGNGAEPAQASFRIEPIEDGVGNAPLLFNTAVAIP